MSNATTHFDCFYSLDEVLAHVVRSGDSHPFGGKLHIRTRQGGVAMQPVLEPSQYLTIGSVDSVVQTIAKIGDMPMFKSKFPWMQDYTIDMALPGQAGTLTPKIGQPMLVWGAELKPTFFDAQVHSPNNLTCYRSKNSLPGFEHSGDLQADNHFMHSVVMTAVKPDVYVASAVGYNHNPLHQYQAVSPFIVLVDHVRRVMTVVPFSLEKATIRESMLIAPLVFRVRHDGSVEWYIPATCPTDGCVNTGDYSDSFRQKVAAVKNDFDGAFHRCLQPAAQIAGVPVVETFRASDAPNAPSGASAVASTRLIFVEEGLTLDAAHAEPDDTKRFVHFGLSLVFCESFEPRPRPPVVLPICAGVAHGHSALALGHKASCSGLFQSVAEWHAFLGRQTSIVLHVSNAGIWREPVMQSVLFRINGVMIIHISENLSEERKQRLKVLSDLKFCCTRMMGSTSLILVRTPDKNTFFYRGPTTLYPAVGGLQFGDKLALDHASIEKMLTPHPLGAVVPFDDQRILLNGAAMCVTAPTVVHDLVAKATGPSGDEWNAVAAQLSVVLSNADIDSIKDAVRKKILLVQEEAVRPLNAECAAAIEILKARFQDAPANIDIMEHTHESRDVVIKLKRRVHDAQESFRVALGRVESLCSFRVVSTRNVGVQQAQRKAAVQQNVARAKNLSVVELSRQLGDASWGFAVARVDPTHARALLLAISARGMDKYLQELANPRRVIHGPADELADLGSLLENHSFASASNCMFLDSDSIHILMEHNQTETHLLSSKGKQLTFTMQGNAHLVLPLYTNGTNKLDGTYIAFMEECNIPDVADYRVTLRNMLSSLEERIPINPASPDLGFGIQMIVLSTMHSIVAEVRDIALLDPMDMKCQILRGLLYLWGTFAGSGQKPVTFAYQLLQPGAVLSLPRLRGEWTIYAMIAHIYPYTKLPQNAFRSNVRNLLVRIIRREYVEPIVDTKAAKQNAAAIASVSKKNRNMALRWNYAACAVLNKADRGLIDENALCDAANNLLDCFPTAPTYTSTHLRRTMLLIRDGESTRINWDIVRMLVASATIKRSGCFAKAKKYRTVSALVAAKRAAFDKLSVQGLTVQNEDAYAVQDYAKMKGDAELVRIPWRVDGIPLPDGASNDDFLARMLPGFRSLVNAEANAAVNESILERVLDDLPNGARALWADSLDPCRLLKTMPFSCLFTLLASVGVHGEHGRAISGVVKVLLVNSAAGVDTAQRLAMQHLFEKYDNVGASVPRSNVIPELD